MKFSFLKWLKITYYVNITMMKLKYILDSRYKYLV